MKKILQKGEKPSVRTVNAGGKGLGLIVCDHSGVRVPKALKGLGISKKELHRHIGWDIGTETIGLYLAKALDMPAVFAEYSRLVVDVNRAPGYRECIIEESDHTVIPANRNLGKAARLQRMKEFYEPYHREVKQQIDRFARRGQKPLMLAVHSFTPEMDGKKRPWHIAVLWNDQKEIAQKVMRELKKNDPKMPIGSNHPYTLKTERYKGLTVYRHAVKRGLPYIFVEFRQDLVDTKPKAEKWARVFIRAIEPILKNHAAWVPKKPRA